MLNSIKVIIAISSVLIGSPGAHAQRACDNSSLQGQYAFKVVGTLVGVFDSSGTLHPLVASQPINAIGQAIFQGNGQYSRVDFAVQNGAPVITPPVTTNDFRAGETGTYDVADDCTGVMTNNIPSGQTNTFAIAVADFGERIFGVVSSTHIPTLPPALVPSGTTCSSGCDVGVNLLIEFTRNSLRRR
jgi:hypothetical protein